MGKRSGLSIPQRREVVLMLLRREKPAAKLAQRFGVSEQTPYRWREEFLAGSEATLANGNMKSSRRGRVNLVSRYRLPCFLLSAQESRRRPPPACLRARMTVTPSD